MNPAELLELSYIKGNIYIVSFPDNQSYLSQIEAANIEYGGRLDDHNGLHDQLLDFPS